MTGQRRRVPAVPGLRSCWERWAEGSLVVKTPRRTALRCTEPGRAESGAPDFDSGHRRRSQTSRRPEGNKETLTATEALCSPPSHVTTAQARLCMEEHPGMT